MDVVGAKFVLLVVVVFWVLPDLSASNVDTCSCYSFHGNSSSRQNGRQHCKKADGDLVSMETKDELIFIQKQLHNETTENGENEWWIGLERESGNRNWKWLSNHTELPFDAGSLQEGEGQAFATIAYNTSMNITSFFFNVITNETIGKGWICEYKKTDCNNVQGGIVCDHEEIVTVKPTINTTTATSISTYVTSPTLLPTATVKIISTTTTITTTPETNTYTTTTPPKISTSTTKPKITIPPSKFTPKVAKLTSAAPATLTTTSATDTTTRKRPFFIDIVTTTSPVHKCLADPYLVVAITVSVIGGVTVAFFTGLFLFVICSKKCSKPPKPVSEKIEMEEGEYENHL